MSDLRLHLVFVFLFVSSFFVTEQIQRFIPTWKDPQVGLLSLVIALIWMGSTLLQRLKGIEDRIKVMKDRLDRHDRKIQALEDELLQR